MKPSYMKIPLIAVRSATVGVKNTTGYVAGFDDKLSVVTCSLTTDGALIFNNVDQVEDFIEQYADQDYGFSSDDYELVEV